LTPAEVKISNGPQKQQHQFKPFKLPNGRIENTGYVQDSPADMEKFYAKSGLWQIRGSASTDNAKDLTKWTNLPGAADTSPAAASRSDTSHVALPAVDTHRDAVAPSVQQIADSAPPSEPTQIIINSGAGSRAQLFNRGPRVEQSVTAPPSAAPSEVPTQTPSVPSADVPQPQPYSGPGSRARLFREQPRN
jgi:hypothetical protein